MESAHSMQLFQEEADPTGVGSSLPWVSIELEKKGEDLCPTNGRNKNLEAKDDGRRSNGKFSTEDPEPETSVLQRPSMSLMM